VNKRAPNVAIDGFVRRSIGLVGRDGTICPSIGFGISEANNSDSATWFLLVV